MDFCPSCEVSLLLVTDFAQNEKFLGCLVICVHKCHVSEISLDMSTKGDFHEWF